MYTVGGVGWGGQRIFLGGSHLLEIGKGGLPKFLTDEEGVANFFSLHLLKKESFFCGFFF